MSDLLPQRSLLATSWWVTWQMPSSGSAAGATLDARIHPSVGIGTTLGPNGRIKIMQQTDLGSSRPCRLSHWSSPVSPGPSCHHERLLPLWAMPPACVDVGC